MTLLRFPRIFGIAAGVLVSGLAVVLMGQQQSQQRFGGAYGELDGRRRELIDDFVARFANVTGQHMPASAFYDDVLTLSTKTTFEAVTHALHDDAADRRVGAGLRRRPGARRARRQRQG